MSEDKQKKETTPQKPKTSQERVTDFIGEQVANTILKLLGVKEEKKEEDSEEE